MARAMLIFEPQDDTSWAPTIVGADSAKRLGRDTLTIGDSLALPRSCYYAHEVGTSQAGRCRGELALPTT